MIVKRYMLPITGQVIDWETFSGDPSNPVKVVGPFQFLREQVLIDSPVIDPETGQPLGPTWPDVVPEAERSLRVTLRFIDVDKGEAEVAITAPQFFHDAFGRWLEGKSAVEILSGLAHLKRPANAPRPAASLVVFNEDRG